MSTDILSKLGLTAEQAAELLREAQYDSTYKIKNNIYIDLAFIQDVKLGLLLSLLRDTDEYKYVYDNIPTYNKRIDNRCCKYFHKLGIHERQLQELLEDPKYTLDILKNSPMTTGYAAFRAEYAKLIDKNIVLDEQSVPYRVFLNIHPFTLSKKAHDEETISKIKRVLNDRIKYVNADSKVFVVDFPTHEMTLTMFKDMHLLMIMDLGALLEDMPKRDWMMRQGKMEDRTFLSPRRHDYKYSLDDLDEDKLDSIFTFGKASMNTVCNFKYVDPTILLETDVNASDPMEAEEDVL